jgi:HSP20 family protein
MRLDDIRHGVETLWDSLAEGWDRLRHSAGALTRYRPPHGADLPDPEQIDDASFVPTSSWAMLGGEVFEDEHRIVVRLEAPGMHKGDFDIEVVDDALIVRGEKRFEHEVGDGRWRMLQCAYGSFMRAVPLTAPVRSERASATYRNGVLKVELPKIEPSAPEARRVMVS